MKLNESIKIKIYYVLLVLLVFGFCFVGFFLKDLLDLLFFLGWGLSVILMALFIGQVENSSYDILKAKKEVSDEYTCLIDKYETYLKSISNYREVMPDNFRFYSKLKNRGVNASIANAVDEFSNELKENNTIILINIDHDNNEWSIRTSGRAIYLTQLKAVMELADIYLSEIARPEGSIVVEKKKMEN